MDLSKFLDMGGYAAFVWPGYALATLAVIGMLVFSLRTLRAREREFAAMRKNRRGGGDDA
jgi:heme exporter protein D